MSKRTEEMPNKSSSGLAHIIFLDDLIFPLLEYRKTCMDKEGYKGDPNAFQPKEQYPLASLVTEYIRNLKAIFKENSSVTAPGTPRFTVEKEVQMDALKSKFLEDFKRIATPGFLTARYQKDFYNAIKTTVSQAVQASSRPSLS